MDDINQTRSLVNQAKREERIAKNDMHFHENQANHDQEQLDIFLTRKAECLNGLKNVKDSGLSIKLIREYEILIEYLDSALESVRDKLENSQKKYEETKTVWQE